MVLSCLLFVALPHLSAGDTTARNDDLPVSTANTCSATCRFLVCENGVTECGETCDDGVHSPYVDDVDVS